MENLKVIALTPARSGSSRIPHKNIKSLLGHPLLAYTIESAKQSMLFEHIIVSTDSSLYGEIAEYYGATVIRRPFPISDKLSPDIDWVSHALNHLKKFQTLPDAFAILRPTSPFRSALAIRNAWDWFKRQQPCDSIRAIEPCRQHPYKMWQYESDIDANHNQDGRIIPFMRENSQHNQPYQALPKVYVQTSALEMAWVDTVFKKGTISGDLVKPCPMPDYEGFDINTPIDWLTAVALVKMNCVTLPNIERKPIKLTTKTIKKKGGEMEIPVIAHD